MQFGTKTNWLDFEVKKSKVKVTERPDMVDWALTGVIFSRLQNVWTCCNETYHSYSLRGSHDTNDIFTVMYSKVKVTDVIFKQCISVVAPYRSTVCYQRPSNMKLFSVWFWRFVPWTFCSADPLFILQCRPWIAAVANALCTLSVKPLQTYSIELCRWLILLDSVTRRVLGGTLIISQRHHYLGYREPQAFTCITSWVSQLIVSLSWIYWHYNFCISPVIDWWEKIMWRWL